jgi:hypothetical protein
MLHLGYYDTYTKDANGNYVVTRQTGYYKIDGSENWVSNYETYKASVQILPSTTENYYHGITDNPSVGWGNPWGSSNSNRVCVTPQGYILIGYSGNGYFTSEDNSKAYFASHPTNIQYKLLHLLHRDLRPSSFRSHSAIRFGVCEERGGQVKQLDKFIPLNSNVTSARTRDFACLSTQTITYISLIRNGILLRLFRFPFERWQDLFRRYRIVVHPI